MPLWSNLYPGVDPDFDEMGGELTMHQIMDPVPQASTEAYPGQYWRAHRTREWEKIRARWARLDETDRNLQRLWKNHMQDRSNQIRHWNHRLIRTKGFPKFNFYGNWSCNGCIPYNGSFTRDYWGTGQKDPW